MKLVNDFETELAGLKEKLLLMAGKAEASVHRAIKALVQRDDDLAREVATLDSEIDQSEIEIDELGIRLLACTDAAGDLRFITVAMKIATDLERVGDEATTISRRTIELSKEPQLKEYVDIPRMAVDAMSMMKDALDAFVYGDTDRARAVIPRDRAIDRLNKQLHRELSSYMVENPSSISRCLNLMVISKSLERVADHAKNIAEQGVYVHEGKDIRHQRSRSERQTTV